MGLQHKKHPENGFLKIKIKAKLGQLSHFSKIFFLKANDFWKKLPKPAIVQLNDRDQTKPSGFVFLIRIP